MRGGHGTSQHGQTLAERIAIQSGTPTRRSPGRHCFVDGEPSLLVEWRQGSSGWEGRVLSTVWVDAVGWAVVERWLPAEVVRPA